MQSHIFTRVSRPPRCAALAGLLIAVSGIYGCNDPPPERAPASEFFPLEQLWDSRSLEHSDTELRGKTLLINFWATWCVPCRREMPGLQRLSDRLGDDGLAVVGVSIDSDGNLAREFLRDNRIRFANYQDREQRLATRLLGIKAFPETLLVAPDGRILQRITGEYRWDDATFENLPGQLRIGIRSTVDG